MNSIRLSLGKNTAVIQCGKVDGKYYVSLAADGPCNKLALGELGGRQKELRCDAEEPLVVPASAKGFTAYWAVENHDVMEVIRLTLDAKTSTLDVAMCAGPDEWLSAASANLELFPNPEYKFYNYRSELAAKPLNEPKRPRGRPRKPVAAETA